MVRVAAPGWGRGGAVRDLDDLPAAGGGIDGSGSDRYLCHCGRGDPDPEVFTGSGRRGRHRGERVLSDSASQRVSESANQRINGLTLGVRGPLC